MTNDSRNGIRERKTGGMTLNLPGVIKTLGEAMYTDPWVALRELIQNANDTCTVRRAPAEGRSKLDMDAPRAYIRVYYERFSQQLVVEDNGAGMTPDEVERFLSVIGKSNTDEVRAALESMGERTWADRLIGRFGLGLLSAFIIGSRVEFQTRSWKSGSPVVWWECAGGQSYEMGILEAEREVGTRVTVYVDPNHTNMFVDEELLVGMIRRFADLLDIPIFYGKTGFRKVNTQYAPWLRDATEKEYYDYLQDRFKDDSVLHVIPVRVDRPATAGEPAIRIHGALFIPRQPDPLRAFVKEFGSVAVYVRRMFVTEDERSLLPRWAKFVKGVIDSPDLRETTSRESIRQDEHFARAQKALSEIILSDLQELASRNRQLFREIAAQHNVVIKTMAIAQRELFDAVKDIVLFKVENSVMSLETYFRETEHSQRVNGRRTIYFSSNVYGLGQHAYLFDQKGWKVIDASSYPDEPFLMTYGEAHPAEVELVSLDTAGGHVFAELNPKPEKWALLEEAFDRNRIEASVVQFEPEDVPAVLVDSKDSNVSDEQLEKIAASQDLPEQIRALFRSVKEARERTKRRMLGRGAILYLNARSRIVQRLAESNKEDPEINDVMIVLYNNALMLSARALHPDSAKKIFDGNNRTIRKLMDYSDDAKQRRAAQTEVTRLREEAAHASALQEQVDRLSQDIAHFEEKVTWLEDENQRLEHMRSALSERSERLRRFEGTPASWVRCFVIKPFHSDYDSFLEGLRTILQRAPYFWQVCVATDKTEQGYIRDDVLKWINDCDCYVVECTERRPSVMAEFGYAHWFHGRQASNRPLILLGKPGSAEEWRKTVADFSAETVQEYDLSSLEARIASFTPFKDLRSHLGRERFLSRYCVPKGSEYFADRASRRYHTIESLLKDMDSDRAAVAPRCGLEDDELTLLVNQLKKTSLT